MAEGGVMGWKFKMNWQLEIARANYSMPLIAAGWPSRLALVLVSGVRQLSRSFGTVWLDPKRTKPEPVGESNNTAEKQ